MARMHTTSPMAFAQSKWWLAGQPDRKFMKRRLDRLQAELIEVFVKEHLPQLSIL